MKTEILHIKSVSDREAIARAGQLLREGAIVALPTETGYGLAAKAEKTVSAQLDDLKGHHSESHPVVHIGSLEAFSRYVPRPSLQARKLIQNMWPGPLTIVSELNKKDLETLKKALPAQTYELVYQDGQIAIRYPDHPISCVVLNEAIAPVVVFITNRLGQSPAVSASDTAAYFDGQIAAILDCPDACRYKTAASVVRIASQGLDILYEGAYSTEKILAAGTVNILFVCTGNTCRSPMAEALCRKYFADKFNCRLDAVQNRGYTVASAGVAAFEAMPASCHALEIGRQKQTPLESHRSRGLTESMIRQADLVFGMTQNHLQAVIRAVPGAEGKCYLLDASGAIADPAGYDVQVYRACAAQIERCLSERMNELL